MGSRTPHYTTPGHWTGYHIFILLASPLGDFAILIASVPGTETEQADRSDKSPHSGMQPAGSCNNRVTQSSVTYNPAVGVWGGAVLPAQLHSQLLPYGQCPDGM